MLELLADKATFELSEGELLELKSLERGFPDWKNEISLEHAAASIGLLGLKIDEPMPKDLKSKILADADQFFGEKVSAAVAEHEPAADLEAASSGTGIDAQQEKQAFDFGRWLGWGLAAAACLALFANIWLTRTGLENESVGTEKTTGGKKRNGETKHSNCLRKRHY